MELFNNIPALIRTNTISIAEVCDFQLLRDNGTHLIFSHFCHFVSLKFVFFRFRKKGSYGTVGRGGMDIGDGIG